MHEEPQFMLDLRQAGFETYEDLELPRIDKVKYHRWPLIDTTIDAGVQGEMLAEDFSQGAAKARLVQVGSQTLLEQVPQDLVDQGVIFTDIFSAMRDYPELVQANYFTKAIKADESKMTAHHAAFMNNGIFVYVPDNVQIDQPLEAKIFQDSRVKQGFNHHVLIVGGQNAHFSYVENYQTLGDEKNPASIMTEIIAADGAVIKYAAIDELGENTHAFFNRRGDFGRDAQIDWAIGMVNDGNIVGDFDTDLTGVGSHSEIKVVGLSAGRQVQAVNSRVTNYADHSIGHILQKGVILDRATLTFNGIGHIIKGAKGADAQQESRLLMFSDQARGDANPILLIDENDVTAGHAASVGRVDPDELYYLLSRGIPLKQAQRLVIRGFLGSVITAIPSKEMRDLLVDTIETKLMSLD
nr:Fe-S cluster assembly protein SufD [Aerococcus urinaehominis]